MKHSQPNHRTVSQRGALLSVALLLLGPLTLIPEAAWASSSCAGTTTVTVNATGVAFGNYDVMNAAATPATSTVTVSSTCNYNFSSSYTVGYTIALSTGSSGSFTPRSLASGTSKLQYNLYTGPSPTTIWGDGTNGTQTVPGSLTGTCQPVFLFIYTCDTPASQNSTAYGNIPAMQNVVAGSYTDSITATVNF